MMRTVVLALALSLAGSAALAQSTAPSPVACAAMEPVMAQYQSHRDQGEALNFSGGQAQPRRDWGSGAETRLARGWGMATPSTGALRRVTEVTPTNALACPNIAAKARAMGSVLTDEETRAVYTSPAGGPRTWVQIISAPVVDDGQDEALVRVRVQRNGLGQVENLYYVRKTKDGWRLSGQRQTPPQELRPLG